MARERYTNDEIESIRRIGRYPHSRESTVSVDILDRLCDMALEANALYPPLAGSTPAEQYEHAERVLMIAAAHEARLRPALKDEPVPTPMLAEDLARLRTVTANWAIAGAATKDLEAMGSPLQQARRAAFHELSELLQAGKLGPWGHPVGKCRCTSEAGDSECEVHPSCSECGRAVDRDVLGKLIACERCHRCDCGHTRGAHTGSVLRGTPSGRECSVCSCLGFHEPMRGGADANTECSATGCMLVCATANLVAAGWTANGAGRWFCRTHPFVSRIVCGFPMSRELTCDLDAGHAGPHLDVAT